MKSVFLRVLTAFGLLFANLTAANEVHHFEWDPVASPQIVDTPFPATVRAVDATGNVVTGFQGPASLNGIVSGPREPTARGQYPSSRGFERFAVSRLQCIYTPSEIGGSGMLTGLDWDFVEPPGQGWNLLIRLKHTAKSDYQSGDSFEGEGLVTVFSGSFTPSSAAGWRAIHFDAPFEYDGQRNLLVDFILQNQNQTFVIPSYQSSWLVQRRVLFGLQGGPFPGLVTWTSGGFAYEGLPNLRFRSWDRIVQVQPVLPVSFVNGVWTGTISIPVANSKLQVSATDQAGPDGKSNVIVVEEPPPPIGGGVIFKEDFENSSLSDVWNLGSTPLVPAAVSSQTSPHGGLQSLYLSSVYPLSFGPNQATLKLNLEGHAGVKLKFWAKGINEASNAPPPSPFGNDAYF